ncbi:MAG: hypothetical protein Q7S79_02710 [bacterium]|nr:hypothetical protein [bacterium]
MEISSLVLFGTIVGLLSTIFGSRTHVGLLGAVLLGVAGALSGSFLVTLLFERPGGIGATTSVFLIPFLGACTLLVLRGTMSQTRGGGTND